jgi:DNA-binding transcriptional regulator/RsmH inhibitor MraZ
MILGVMDHIEIWDKARYEAKWRGFLARGTLSEAGRAGGVAG